MRVKKLSMFLAISTLLIISGLSIRVSIYAACDSTLQCCPISGACDNSNSNCEVTIPGGKNYCIRNSGCENIYTSSSDSCQKCTSQFNYQYQVYGCGSNQPGGNDSSGNPITQCTTAYDSTCKNNFNPNNAGCLIPLDSSERPCWRYEPDKNSIQFYGKPSDAAVTETNNATPTDDANCEYNPIVPYDTRIAGSSSSTPIIYAGQPYNWTVGEWNQGGTEWATNSYSLEFHYYTGKNDPGINGNNSVVVGLPKNVAWNSGVNVAYTDISPLTAGTYTYVWQIYDSNNASYFPTSSSQQCSAAVQVVMPTCDTAPVCTGTCTPTSSTSCGTSVVGTQNNCTYTAWSGAATYNGVTNYDSTWCTQTAAPNQPCTTSATCSTGSCVSGTCQDNPPVINSLQLGSGTTPSKTGKFPIVGNQSVQGGANWLNPLNITLNATPGSAGSISSFDVALYDSSLGTKTTLADVKQILNPSNKLINGVLLGFDGTNHYVWDPSQIPAWVNLETITLPTAQTYYVCMSQSQLPRGVVGQTDTGLGQKVCPSNKPYLIYTVKPNGSGILNGVYSAKWQVTFDKNFGNRTFYDWSSVEDSNFNSTSGNAVVTPDVSPSPGASLPLAKANNDLFLALSSYVRKLIARL